MSDNIPETGDVVIHNSDSDETPSYAIYAVPGPDQFGCATRGEAERMARTGFCFLFSHPLQVSRCLKPKTYPSHLNRLESQKRTSR